MVILAHYCAGGDNPVPLGFVKALSLKAVVKKWEKT